MELWLANVVALSLQVACVVASAGVLIAALRITSPSLHYYSWRLVLATCLVLPWLQSPKTAAELAIEDVIVADPGGPIRVGLLTPAGGDAGPDVAPLLFGVLALGAVTRLTWLGIGAVRLRRWRAEGVEVPLCDQHSLQTTMGTRADVRYVDGISQPATFGWRRPVILLPATLRANPDARRAVLAHELLHVKRHDWCWVVAEELLRASCWFHPLVWWVITRIQLAREEVVDALAVGILGDRRAYLRALVQFSDEASLAPAPAFARRRHLFRRIVLLSREDAMSARRIAASACLLTLVLITVSWSFASAFPMQATASAVIQSEPGPLERSAKLTSPENPVPPPIYQPEAVRPAAPGAEKADASVTLRTVIDEQGNIAEVRLTSFTFRPEGQATTLMGGPESIDRVSNPLLQQFIEAAALAVRQARYQAPSNGPAVFTTIVHFSENAPMASVRTVPMVQRVSAEGALKVGDVIKPPVKIKDARPVYPLEARDARVQGIVILEVRIEPDGRVGSAGVLRSIPLLDQAALDAVYQWQFQPTLLNGVAVPVIMTVTIQFTL